MLDHPEKTPKLLAALKAAVPFDVKLTEQLVKYLRAQHLAGADRKQHTVSDLSYAGDEGGMCRRKNKKHSLSPSLTSTCRGPCRLPHPLPIIRSIG